MGGSGGDDDDGDEALGCFVLVASVAEELLAASELVCAAGAGGVTVLLGPCPSCSSDMAGGSHTSTNAFSAAKCQKH